MNDLLPFIVIGITTGSVYGLAGVGFVITYKTSGVLNFAQGALGTLAAFLFYTLHVTHGMPWPYAAAICVLGLGTALGLGYEQLARRLADQTLAFQVVGTVGVLLTIEAGCTLAYGSTARPFPPFLSVDTFEFAGTNVGYDSLIIFLTSVVLTSALYVYFRTTRRGKAMRAVVDDPDLLAISGTSPSQVRRWAWIVGCCFATLAGLLIAPRENLDAFALTLLALQSFGAAAVGRFTSLPLTWFGGVGIGLLSSLLSKYIVNATGVLGGLPASVPFVVLFLVLLVIPRGRLAIPHVRRLRHEAPQRVSLRVQGVAGIVLLAFLITVPSFVGIKLTVWTIALIYSVLLLSLGLLVRTSGQVSLCQITFAAIGAVGFSKFAHAGVPWLLALILGGLVAVPIGALLAIPAIRLSGVYLALATFGFGIIVQTMFYQSDVMFGFSGVGLSMPRPHLGSLSIDSDKGFYYVVLVITAVIMLGTVGLIRSRMGRLLRGLGDSPLALSTAGSNVTQLRVAVFCISAFMAAIAGALYGVVLSQVTGETYDPLTSLTYVAVMLVTVGGEPWYALLAGAGLGLVPGYWPSTDTTNYLNLAFGVVALTVAAGIRLGAPAAIRRRMVRPELSPGSAAAEPVNAPRHDLRLEVRGVSMRFGGVVAVDNLTLVASTGKVTGLIGPNGAGKTTTFNICSGLLKPSSGGVYLNGRKITRSSPARRAQLGVGRTFQQMQLFESMTVQENITVACEAHLSGMGPLRQLVPRANDRKVIAGYVAEALDMCGLVELRNKDVASLSTGQRRLVEVARCIAAPFRLVLLDEPSSGLDSTETRRLGEILQEIVTRRDMGILLVEHDMDLVSQLCEYVYVTDFGQLIFEGDVAELHHDDRVRRAYLGEPLVAVAP